jgi:hypothetical protein
MSPKFCFVIFGDSFNLFRSHPLRKYCAAVQKLSSHRPTNFVLRRRANHLYASAPSCPNKRGGSRSPRTRGRVRWTLASSQGVRGDKRTAKPCGPDAPTLASTRDNAAHCAGMVARKPGSPGRARSKPLKPLRRECRCTGEPVVTNSYVFHFYIRGCGCDWASGIPCAL